MSEDWLQPPVPQKKQTKVHFRLWIFTELTLGKNTIPFDFEMRSCCVTKLALNLKSSCLSLLDDLIPFLFCLIHAVLKLSFSQAWTLLWVGVFT